MFYASWQTIKVLSSDAKYLGAQTGMVAVLHTWGQQLWLHPHLHCIVPGGGITKGNKWKQLVNSGSNRKKKYLFPQQAMAKIFRAKFVAKLREEVIIPQGVSKSIFSKNWVVYAKQPFGTAKTVVEYLGRYTHKIALSNHRLQSVDNQRVSFDYKDYNKGGKRCLAVLEASEFLRRFSSHILPKGFVRMRHYGILASKNKSKQLNIAKTELGQQPWTKVIIDWKTIALSKLGVNPDKCSKCKIGDLTVLQTILASRGPPVFKIAPNLNFLTR